jgi:hypothetical protein
MPSPKLRRPTLRMLDGGDIGEYWSADNAQFEATNPNFIQRVGRQLNPVTGFGSNLGQLHDAVGQGHPLDAAVAVASSIPGFAAMRNVAVPGAGLVKATVQNLPSLRSTFTSAGYDEANAEPLPPAQPRRRLIR